MPPEMGASADADPSNRCVRDCRQRSCSLAHQSSRSSGEWGGVKTADGSLDEDARVHRSRSSIGDEARLAKDLAATRRRIGFWRHPIVTLR